MWSSSALYVPRLAGNVARSSIRSLILLVTFSSVKTSPNFSLKSDGTVVVEVEEETTAEDQPRQDIVVVEGMEKMKILVGFHSLCHWLKDGMQLEQGLYKADSHSQVAFVLVVAAARTFWLQKFSVNEQQCGKTKSGFQINSWCGGQSVKLYCAVCTFDVCN
ncbi:hypothetical protein WICPIJ_005473 [Wickerhamomyces pijperi]|uniref:Uncharacterized protein n=1 Tax=Wickerhamomyces pijperi TaxID=599730 RepID=A0A9P8Q3S5_WICPI|nr:hypothetical protein WICPIJ_005473 [Wickerhamomyces pijperi]